MEHDPLSAYCFFMLGLLLPFLLNKLPHRRPWDPDLLPNEEREQARSKYFDAFFSFFLSYGSALLDPFFLPASLGLMLAGQIYIYRETHYFRHNVLLALPFLLVAGCAYWSQSGHLKLGVLLVSMVLVGLYLYLLDRPED